MIAFVFDRRSLVLLGVGAAFLGLVLVAIGFLLGVQYGVLPPPAVTQSTTAQTNLPALPARVTGFANDSAAPEPGTDVGNSDADPAAPSEETGASESSLAAGSDPESLPYLDAPANDEPSAESAPGPPATATPPSRARAFSAAPRLDSPSDPIVDSRGGEPVSLAPSPRSAPDLTDQPADRPAEPQTGSAASITSAAITAMSTGESGRYAVQVGAYRERLNCDAMIQKLTSRGFEPYVVEIVRDGKSPLYAVRVGRFGDRAAAGKAASSLRSKAGVPVVVLSIG
ncbi:MAG TPA: SPOR domain-containing protein [Thermoanaerobaculia bacterium]|jgi:septal ring-binding cell division protein DamX|nr:SPOR domain-containing protein [Thermoanaerobaculia bacterium]